MMSDNMHDVIKRFKNQSNDILQWRNQDFSWRADQFFRGVARQVSIANRLQIFMYKFYHETDLCGYAQFYIIIYALNTY